MAIQNKTQDSGMSGMMGESNGGRFQNERQYGDDGGSSQDFHSFLGGYNSEFVSGGTGGEVFTKMRDKLGEICKALCKEKLNHRLLPVNKEDYPELKFSFLIIASQIKGHEDKVAYHILILEGTGDPLLPTTVSDGTRNITFSRVTGHAYDQRMQAIAAEIISVNYRNSTSYSTAAEVVRRTVDPEKDMSKMMDVAKNAILACLSKLASVTGMNRPFRLDKAGPAYRFHVEMANNKAGVVYDEQGAPTRSSAIITFSSEKRTRNQPIDDIVNQPNNTEMVTQVTGFVNAIWAPGINNNGFGFNNGFQQMGPNGIPILPSQKFAAEFVTTGIRTPYGTSTAAVMLAIVTMLMTSDSDNWMQLNIPQYLINGGRPNPSGRNHALDDLGALNVLGNFKGETDKNGFGSPVDMSLMSGKLSEISRYITTLFRPGLVLSIDVPECGPQSWYLNVFGRAANGDKDAVNEILAASEEITGGNFSKYWPEDANTIFTNSTQVPLGFYMDGGQSRDIRDIDLVALCSLLRNNPEEIHNWTRAFSDTSLSWVARLSMIETMIKHALHDQCEITGRAFRCTFRSDFVKALSLGFREMNLQTTISTPLSSDQLQSGVAAPNFINNSLTMATNTFNNNGVFGNFNGSNSFTSGNVANRFF